MSLPGSTDTAQAGGEQKRAIDEVRTAMTIAQKFPRDIGRAMQAVKTECDQIKLAVDALYHYKRDDANSHVGPSIRLLEVFSRNWKHIECGWRELRRFSDPVTGFEASECEAYAWDMENNFRERRKLYVTLARVRPGSPPAPITGAREQFEYIASYAQRWKRSCLEAVIPQWAVDQAKDWCRQTIETKVDLTEDTVSDLIASFAEIGVDSGQLAGYLGHAATVAELTKREYMRLRMIHKTVKDGEARAREFFDMEQPPEHRVDELTRKVNAATGGGTRKRKKKTRKKKAGKRAAGKSGPAASSKGS